MSEVTIYVCENFYPDFKNMLSAKEFEDVKLVSYPTMCETRRNKSETEKALKTAIDLHDQGLVVCSKQCGIIKLFPENPPFQMITGNYCFQHLASEQFIEYIVKNGGYIIGAGWLNDWKNHIASMGFDQETARKFYKEFCRELVFFDTGSNIQAEAALKKLSEFLELPYSIIPSNIEVAGFLIKSELYKWRLHNNQNEYSKTIRAAQSQCAEYSALLHMIGKISSDTNKRDAIEKIKSIFLGLFGAQEFIYHSNDLFGQTLNPDINKYFADEKNEYLLLDKEKKFYVILRQNEKIHGLIQVGAFLFPQYIEKYLNFALEICKVSGLVLSNLEHYEKIIKSEGELKYLSSHDALTNLYNRTFVNGFVASEHAFQDVGIFIFDIDKLKLVNDKYGHLKGDQLLIGFAEIVKRCFRETDIVARMGGDEFIAIIPECTHKMAEIYLNRLNEAVQIYNNALKEECFKISFSSGFAIGTNLSESYETLLNKADKLMYAHKFSK